MSEERKIIEALSNISKKTAIQPVVEYAVVTSRDDSKCFVDVKLEDGLELFGVRLRPIVSSSKKVVIYPKISTKVLIQNIKSSAEWHVCSLEEADNIVIQLDEGLILETKTLAIKNEQSDLDIKKLNAEFENVKISAKDTKYDCEKIVFNGGSNKGMVKIKELEQNLGMLKKAFTDMKVDIFNALIAVGIGPAANGSAGAASFGTSSFPRIINFNNMENKQIEH